jgi:hypothetical protein
MRGDPADKGFIDNSGTVEHIGSVNKAARRKSHTKSPNSIARLNRWICENLSIGCLVERELIPPANYPANL